MPASGKWSKSLSSVTPVKKDDKPSVPAPQQLALPATFTQRAAAWTWDMVPFQILLHLLAYGLLPDTNLDQLQIDQALQVLLNLMGLFVGSVLVWTLYHVGCETVFGTTLGKHLLGLRVDLGEVSMWGRWRRANARHAASLFSWITLNLGHALALWRPDKKMLHDMISNTQVVQDTKHFFASWAPLDPETHKKFLVAAAVIQGVVFVVFNIILVSTLLSAMELAQAGAAYG